MNKKDLEYLGTLGEERIIELAQDLDVEVPEDVSVNEAAMQKMKEGIINAVEAIGQTLEFFVKSSEVVEEEIEEKPKKSRKKKEDNNDLSTMTFGKLSKVKEEINKEKVEKKAMKLKRIQITCNNQNKRNWTGEIFTVQNGSLGAPIRKFVQFNVPTHVPEILYNTIKERQLQIFYTEKASNGQKVTRSKLINEFSVTDLPPITSAELDAIKKKQLAEASVG